MIKTPMMLLLAGEDAVNEQIMEFAVRDIAENGFDAVCLEFRNSKYDEFDKEGQNAMRFICNEAKKSGLKFVKIMPHCHDKILGKYPFLKRQFVREYSINAENNSFRLKTEEIEGVLPEKIFAAYHIKRDKCGNIINAENILSSISCSVEEGYVVCNNCPDGEILIYPIYIVNAADYAHEKADIILDEFLKIYADYPLDGFAMDEFGAGSRNEGCYLCGDGFLNRFKQKYGYDFKDKIYLMNSRGTDNSFASVRYNYYMLTNDVTLEYQMSAKKKFCDIFGKDIFIGFHHTWFGEGNSGDLWAGDINYFELAGALSGGFVDAQYDAERTMTSMTLLAESIARYTKEGQAYNMCWDRFSTANKMDYFHRLLAVRNVNWVGHAYSCTISKNTEYESFIYDFKTLSDTWGNIPLCIRREHRMSDFIGDACSRAKIAITYNWESNAYFNNDYMHYHRLSLKALADKLVINNIPADIIPSYETDFESYEVIFVLWPAMMVKPQWEALKKQIKEGKKVYFIGPPAMVTTDGEDISAEFEEITGTHIERVSEFMGGHEYIAWDLWFTEKRIHMPVYLDNRNMMDFVNGNVRYYGYELPLTDMFYNVINELSEYQLIHSDRVISKSFYNKNAAILTITSRWQSKINESFVFENRNIEIKNGLIAGIKILEGTVVQLISEPGAEILIDGQRMEYEIL